MEVDTNIKLCNYLFVGQIFFGREGKMYSAIAVANWFIAKNLTDRSDLTHLKLQKLLYYAQGWFMANYDEPLFGDDIEAWKHGPVIESIYRILKKSKNSEIETPLKGPIVQNVLYSEGYPEIDKQDERTNDFLEIFWNTYSKTDAWALVNNTHEKGSPWEQVASYRNNVNYVIPKELIMSYFKNKLSTQPE
jgi:uncharacterized phage-associated protein